MISNPHCARQQTKRVTFSIRQTIWGLFLRLPVTASERVHKFKLKILFLQLPRKALEQKLVEINELCFKRGELFTFDSKTTSM